MQVVCSEGEHFTDERVVLCKKCGLIFLNPREAYVEEFYQSDEYNEVIREGAAPSENMIKKTRSLSEVRVPLVAEFLPEAGTHLDIGTGTGFFPKGVKEHTNLDVIAIEATPGFAKWAAETHGITVINDMFPCKIPVDDIVSVSLIHVAEHLSNPFTAIMRIYDLLPIDGIFILEYPDMLRAVSRDSFSAKHYFQKSHIYEFHFGFLVKFLLELGFSLESAHSYKEFPIDKNVMMVLRKTDTPTPVINESTPEKILTFLEMHNVPVRPEVSK